MKAVRGRLARTVALVAAMPPAVALASGPNQATTPAEAVGPAGLPTGWSRTVGQGGETFLKGGDPFEAAVLANEVPASTAAEVEVVTARLFRALGCSAAPPMPRGGSVGPFGEAPRCFALFAPSPGGHRVAVGAAFTPEAEAEGLGIARRVSAVGGAPAVMSTQPGLPAVEADAAALDASLAAALNAVPKRNLPTHMTLRRGIRFNGTNIDFDYKLWMLFADGLATSCMKWDPAKHAPTAEFFASLKASARCRVARWRRVAGGAAFDDDPKGGPSTLEDRPAPPRGTRFAGDWEWTSTFSTLGQVGPGQLLINSEVMSLSRDGAFRLGAEKRNQSSLDRNITRSPTLSGRYLVDGHMIAMAADGRVERHFFFVPGDPTDADVLFWFDGRLMGRK